MNPSVPRLAAVPAVVLLAAGVLALSASLIPFETVRASIDRSARSGAVHEYTPAVHASLALALRLAGGAALVAGLAAWRMRGFLGTLFARLRQEFRTGLHALRPAREDLGTWAGLLVLIALAAGLRLAFLGQPIRYDEAFTHAEYAGRPLYVLVSKYDLPNNHVFHSLCVHVACGLLGDAPWAIRLPAFLAGLLMVPAAYAAARALYDRPTGLLCAALVAGSSILVEYSTNARGYTLLALFFLLLIRLGCSLQGRKNLIGWGLFSVLAALGLWTVPTMLFPYGAVVLWLAIYSLWGNETRNTYGRAVLVWLGGSCVLTVALTAVLYAPVLLVSGIKALTANQYVAPAEGQWWAQLPPMLASTWGQWQRDVPMPLAVALGAGFVAAVVRPTSRAVLLAGTTLLWSAAVVAVQRVVPFERVWLFALPLYLCVASAGLVELTRLCRTPAAVRYALAGAAAVLLSWQVLASRQVERSTETGTLPDAAEVAAFLKDRLGPGDRVIAWCPSDLPLDYYCRQFGVRGRVVGSAGWRKDEPDWKGERLLAVVNKRHGQTFAALAQRYRLAEVSDPAAARVVWDGDSAAVYECAARRGAGPFSLTDIRAGR
jgi:hypothetical protein